MVFNKISSTGNVDLLHISGKKDRKKLLDAWAAIMNGFIKEFGLNDDYKQYLKLMTDAVSLNYDIYIKGQKWKKIKAKSKIAQAQALMSSGESSISETFAEISKQMGFRIDPQTTTVFEYYGYIKHLNKANGR